MIETAILTPQGLQVTPYQAASLAEAAPHEPEGVYTITRTYKGDHALLLDSHLDRLEESARLEAIPLCLDRPALRAALRTLIKRAGYPDARFRITVPRHAPDQLYLALEPLQAPSPELRQKGVSVATVHAQRHNPVAKTTAWMSQRREATRDLPPETYEAILLNENGELLEGTSSNFYAVLDGELRTAGEGILNGISRQALLACLGDFLPLRLEAVHLDDVPRLREAFLTSSSRGVIPIVKIDGVALSGGVPQAATLELARRYDAWTDAHLEAI
jgi:branched-chain amino acid aminotransferase